MSRRSTPQWLRAIARKAQQTFHSDEPFDRPAYSSRHDEQGWLLYLYPRSNELLGGKHDGQRIRPHFQVCVTGLMTLFDAIPHVSWDIPNDFTGELDGPCLLLEGFVGGEAVELLIFDRPPSTAKLGMLIDWQRGGSKRCERRDN